MNKRQAAKAERDHTKASFEQLWDKASAAGLAAAEKLVPMPMIVLNEDGSYCDTVPEGEFGSTTVIMPGRDPFASWVARSKRGTRYPRQCVSIYLHYKFQMQHSRAYAAAFADTLRGAGVRVDRVTERLD